MNCVHLYDSTIDKICNGMFTRIINIEGSNLSIERLHLEEHFSKGTCKTKKFEKT